MEIINLSKEDILKVQELTGKDLSAWLRTD